MTWLPGLILQSDYETDSDYENGVYSAFEQDWIYGSAPQFQGLEVRIRRGPLIDGREYTFHHITTEGYYENHRTVAIPRCERIRWIRSMIENATTEDLPVWKAEKSGEVNTHIALSDFSYILALGSRSDYFLLLTAFPILGQTKRQKRRREYEAYIKKTGAAR